MKWITREHLKVDRVACPWLVRRFIDPDAVFEFLPRDTDWSRVTAGEALRWIVHGFSALGLSDHEILDREFIICDALYVDADAGPEDPQRT